MPYAGGLLLEAAGGAEGAGAEGAEYGLYTTGGALPTNCWGFASCLEFINTRHSHKADMVY